MTTQADGKVQIGNKGALLALDYLIAPEDDTGAIGLIFGGSLRRFRQLAIGTGGIDSLGPITQNGAPLSGFNPSVVSITSADSPYAAVVTAFTTIRVSVTAGAISVNLPTSASCPKFLCNVKLLTNTANLTTVFANGAETIDAAGSVILSSQWTNLTIQSRVDGTGWDIL